MDDLGRSQRAMLLARLVAVPWGLLILLTHGVPPYPDGVLGAGLALMGVLAVGAVGVWLADVLDRERRFARVTALVGLGLDLFVAGAFVWLNAFDPGAALWAVLFILPLEGAILFGLGGALSTWAITALIYAAREALVIPDFGGSFSVNSIAFRMGIGLLIALVAGLMARNLRRERARLAAALTDLQRIDTWRRRLIGALGHDVRNPLATIVGTLQTLEDRGPDLDRETTELLLQGAGRQAQRLERLASGLLDLARLEEGRLALEFGDVNVAEVVRTVVGLTPPSAHPVGCTVAPGVVARADRDRLEQVLVNLVDNAQRHGAPPIHIHVGARDAHVELRVVDGGDGAVELDEDGLPGSGYGLTIVKGLVGAMGGHLRYGREDGHSVVTVTLPAAPPAVVLTLPEPARHPA
ncbi:MAG: HAMP domain-containing histidine kinase [Actinobacteria bacterium]|nr:HAMP domain-containing histidine kinase [Actinomycetota bacterium]